jgi:hypothetical protein
MSQRSPPSRSLLATEPVEWRQGIDGLAAVCRQRLGDPPLAGAGSVWRNRSATARQRVLYDGQGYWMMMTSLSEGRLAWRSQRPDARVPLAARALILLPWQGEPEQAQTAQGWRRVASGEARLLA